MMLIFSNYSCKDKEAKPNSNEKYYEHNEDTVYPLSLRFYFSDSLGNNLVPCGLPDTSVFNPKDFYVTSDSFSDHFYYKYIKHQNDNTCEYSFEFGELSYVIRLSSQYQIDSTYKVKICFDNECNTLIQRIYSRAELSKYFIETGKNLHETKWVLWDGDTILINTPSVIIPLVIK
jgi:hypothetical protein